MDSVFFPIREKMCFLSDIPLKGFDGRELTYTQGKTLGGT